MVCFSQHQASGAGTHTGLVLDYAAIDLPVFTASSRDYVRLKGCVHLHILNTFIHSRYRTLDKSGVTETQSASLT